jgi:predicted N-acetyltransferase YhbS
VDKINIKVMTAADKPAVMSILHTTPEFLPHEVVVAEELIDSFLENREASGYHILVARSVEKIYGYICYGDTPLTETTWDIYWIAVSRDNQGKGIGRLLMKQAEDNIKNMGGKLIVVETSGKADYNKTRQFYHSINYQLVCSIAEYYAPNDDLVIFTKRL